VPTGPVRLLPGTWPIASGGRTALHGRRSSRTRLLVDVPWIDSRRATSRRPERPRPRPAAPSRPCPATRCMVWLSGQLRTRGVPEQARRSVAVPSTMARAPRLARARSTGVVPVVMPVPCNRRARSATEGADRSARRVNSLKDSRATFCSSARIRDPPCDGARSAMNTLRSEGPGPVPSGDGYLP
jgi:hypothetical protein